MAKGTTFLDIFSSSAYIWVDDVGVSKKMLFSTALGPCSIKVFNLKYQSIMATKYKQYFELMVKQNKEVFDSFKLIHDGFMENPGKWRDEFNKQGRDIQDIVRRYENLLCNQSEGSGYSKYSTQLADKFQSEVKKYLPKYDFIGQE